MSDNTVGKLKELAKRRGFFLPSNEVYGGTAGFYTFGPNGAALKRNIEDAWRERFTYGEGHREIESPTVMPEAVFEASGHLEGFDDMIIDCEECQTSHRADHLIEDNTDIEEAESLPVEKVAELISENNIQCPNCGSELAGAEVEDFNLMFETNIGPGSSSPGYLRPETAQGIFVEFPQLKEYARNQLPFGITQIGKAYRNEISPRKSIIRVREFTQAELEHFIDPEEDEPELGHVEEVEVELYPISEQEKEDGEIITTTIGDAVEDGIIESDWIGYYLGITKKWYESLGVNMEKFRFRQHLEGERAHYSEDCWDAEAFVANDWVELAGFSYRGCYDVSKHQEHSCEDFTVFKPYDEPKTVEKVTVSPDMGFLGPEFGDQAGEIAEELERLAEEEPKRFEENDEIEMEIDGDNVEVPVEKIGFAREDVEEAGEHVLPHVVEPSFGVDRLLYTVLEHSYDEDEVDDEARKVLRIKPDIAPLDVAVFPLMDREGMGEKARELAGELRNRGFSVKYDDSGAIGRRYRRQDEIGTPVCVTVDHQSLEDGTVTLRDRDSTHQVRVDIENLESRLREFLETGEF